MSTLATLKKQLATASGPVTLNEELLGNAYMVQQWQRYLKTDAITLSVANKVEDNSSLLLEGSSSSILGVNLQLSIYLFEVTNFAGNPTLESAVVFSGKLADVLDFAPLTTQFEVELPVTGPTIVSSANFSQLTFDLAVFQKIPEPLRPYVKTGLNLQPKFTVPAALSAIQSFLPTGTFDCLLSLTYYGNSGDVCFSAIINNTHAFGPFQANMSSFSVRAGINNGKRQPLFVDFNGSLAVGSLVIPISLNFAEGGGFKITSVFKQMDPVQIGDIASLFGSENPLKQLPVANIVADKISLTRFELDYDLPKKQFSSVYIELANDNGTWFIIPEILSIKQLKLVWFIQQPFAKARNTVFQMSGLMDFGGTGIYMETLFPDFTVVGQLIPGAKINVLDGLKELSPPIGDLLKPLKMDSLKIMDIDLVAKPRNKSFELEMLVAADWTLFEINSKPYKIKEVSLDIAYENREFGGTVAGILDFAGWDIQITAYIDDPLSIEGVIPYLNFSELIEEFSMGMIEVPVDFAFKDIVFDITPKTKEFYLSGVSAEPWDMEFDFLPKISIQNVGIEVTKTTAATDYTFFGSIVLAEKYTLTITLTKNKVGAEMGWLIDGHFSASEPINFIALINDLIPGESFDLPDDIVNIDVNDVQISIDTLGKVYRITVNTHAGIDLGSVGEIAIKSCEFEYKKVGAEKLWSIESMGYIELGTYLNLDTTIQVLKEPA